MVRTDRAAALAALGIAALALACAPERARPNVLVITIDTLRADHLGCYGYPRPTSPAIDAFARGAVVFDNASSSSSWTLPALTSLWTSLWCRTHGCTDVEKRLDPSFETWAETLRDAGWDTALVGGHLFVEPGYGLTQGFTHVDAEIVQTDATIASHEVTDRGLAFLGHKAAAKDGVPWLLWLHYFDPHDDYLPHEGLSERFGTERPIDLYDGEIAYTDRHVGRLLEGLERLGLAGDTIVLLTADHGEEFGEHGNHGHGYTLYQEVVRVPLILRAPGLAPRRVGELVRSVDVLPTVLALAGLEPRREIEGRSLLPLVAGAEGDERAAVSEVSWHATQDMRALQVGGFKYVDHRLGGGTLNLLFDLDRDPFEVCNDEALDPLLVQALRGELDARLEAAERRARSYGSSQSSALAPEEQDRLQRLGYVGDDG